MIIDYKKLLEKYIHYVEEAEGTNNITYCDRRPFTDTVFTPEEWDALVELANLENKINNNE